jgi:hypothetical protein
MFGLIGMCSVIVATYAVVLGFEIRAVSRLIEVGSLTTVRTLVVPFVASTVSVTGTYLALLVARPAWTVWDVLAGIALTVPLYVLLVYALDKDTVGELRRLLANRGGVRTAEAIGA